MTASLPRRPGPRPTAPENKNAFTLRNPENEGILHESARKPFASAGLILLFAEKCPEPFGADERSQTGILTPDLQPRSRLPAGRSRGPQWPLGTRSPLQWRNRPRLSRGSQSSGCGLERTRRSSLSKNSAFLSPPRHPGKLKTQPCAAPNRKSPPPPRAAPCPGAASSGSASGRARCDGSPNMTGRTGDRPVRADRSFTRVSPTAAAVRGQRAGPAARPRAVSTMSARLPAPNAPAAPPTSNTARSPP